MQLPPDYAERVYAGVLGKIIGVYLGRPFEQWSYERILAELGEITYYVHGKLGMPLVVTDDDISGTFTFLRAMPDYDNAVDLTPAQIGQTWLNYIVEKRTILWWGGLGNSTEHTAYLRLLNGLSAPESGSIARNSKVVAEQIGSQIFIDGWGMIAPGDPDLAADFARRAASVSHDGEAIYGAQVIAAMEALAFVEPDLNALLDIATALIPYDSLIFKLIADIRKWHQTYEDWRDARAKIVEIYGYDKYGGNCHIVPNHALVILSLLYGDDDFQKSLMIVNTSGWDTDCNSGNVGCLLGIKNGLAAFNSGQNWRAPVADRLYLSSADGGRAITDAAAEALHVVNIGRALLGEKPLAPKDGARFHFEFPGSVQGFMAEHATLENVAGHSEKGTRSLAVHYRDLVPGRPARISTATFIQPDAINMPGYELLASPTLYSGQRLRARVSAKGTNAQAINCRLYLQVYGEADHVFPVYGADAYLEPGVSQELTWTVPDTRGSPIAAVGLELRTEQSAQGTVYLDYLTWDGTPEVTLMRPSYSGKMWRRAWVDAVDYFDAWAPESFRIVQNRGIGLLIQGTREWSDYTVSADVTPHLAEAVGIAARVQGLRRYYALLLVDKNSVQLVKELDGTTVMDQRAFNWEFGRTYHLKIEAKGSIIRGWIDGRQLFEVVDPSAPLSGGAVALVVREGRLGVEKVVVSGVG